MYTPYNSSDPIQNGQTSNTSSNREAQNPTAPGSGSGAAPYTAQTNSGTAPTAVPGADGSYHSGVNQPGTGGYPSSQNGTYQQPAAYTWAPRSYGAPQQASPYYAQPQPAQPAKPPKQKKAKKHGGKFALKALAAVLACAVVSFSSVGVFALLIQNGIVNVESKGESGKTAAFTLYKQADSTENATPTVTGESMTAQQVAKQVTPSVVCVQNYQITQNYFSFGYGYGYVEGQDSEAGLSPMGEGSGIIISKDGYIVTNQHVIDGATNIKVVTSEGLTYEAELVGEDVQTDLAVIKVTTEDELTPAEFGSSQDLQVADEVMAIGNPGGLQLNSSVTFGRISALNRQVQNSDTGYSMTCIQTDAAINPGNSGGALVDMNGHVVGINSSKIVATGYEGLGFAIPSDTVQPIVSDLIEYHYVKDRPAAGFSGQYVERLRASWFGMNAGYYVTQVVSEEARQSGLQRGDMITAVDDAQITSDFTISAYIADKKPGDTVTLTVERNGQSGQIELTLAENTGKSE